MHRPGLTSVVLTELHSGLSYAALVSDACECCLSVDDERAMAVRGGPPPSDGRMPCRQSSHAPTWIDSFKPSDGTDVKRVLNHVLRVVLVNRQLVNLSLALDRSTDSGSTDQSQFDNQLRVA